MATTEEIYKPSTFLKDYSTKVSCAVATTKTTRIPTTAGMAQKIPPYEIALTIERNPEKMKAFSPCEMVIYVPHEEKIVTKQYVIQLLKLKQIERVSLLLKKIFLEFLSFSNRVNFFFLVQILIEATMDPSIPPGPNLMNFFFTCLRCVKLIQIFTSSMMSKITVHYKKLMEHRHIFLSYSAYGFSQPRAPPQPPKRFTFHHQKSPSSLKMIDSRSSSSVNTNNKENSDCSSNDDDDHHQHPTTTMNRPPLNTPLVEKNNNNNNPNKLKVSNVDTDDNGCNDLQIIDTRDDSEMVSLDDLLSSTAVSFQNKTLSPCSLDELDTLYDDYFHYYYHDDSTEITESFNCETLDLSNSLFPLS